VYNFLNLNLYLGSKLVSTEGIVFEPASTNANCCTKESISKQDNGTEYRQPIVYFKDKRTKCFGLNSESKGTATFQRWIDVALDHYIGVNGTDFRGICYQNWRYVPKGKITYNC